jgi:hypothetical protein
MLVAADCCYSIVKERANTTFLTRKKRLILPFVRLKVKRKNRPKTRKNPSLSTCHPEPKYQKAFHGIHSLRCEGEGSAPLLPMGDTTP